VRLGALLECLLDLLAPMKANRRESRVFTRVLPSLNARVLVAEDNPVNQKVVRVMLERLGCKPEIVPTGAAAVEAAALGGWDCILMDCQMPEMDGYEATKRIRITEAGARRIPIMALTASAMQGDKERCMEAGMDEYLTKPLNLDALAGALDRALRLNPPTPVVPEPEPLEDDIGPDLSRLREMVGDDEPLIDELLGSFLVAGAERLTALDAAVGARDATAIAQAAHSIKGAAANFGAQQVTEIAGILERQGRNQQVEPACQTRPLLHAAFTRLRARVLATRPNVKLPVAERPGVELN
jgi:CheY-like chemotaxis protein/HPt (histidine-containing phosphotransfer) domain-containing protein